MFVNVNNILAIVDEKELIATFRPKDRDFDSIEVPTAKETISIKDGKDYVKLNWLSEDNSFGYQTEWVQKAIKIFSDMGCKRKDLIMYVRIRLVLHISII